MANHLNAPHPAPTVQGPLPLPHTCTAFLNQPQPTPQDKAMRRRRSRRTSLTHAPPLSTPNQQRLLKNDCYFWATGVLVATWT